MIPALPQMSFLCLNLLLDSLAIVGGTVHLQQAGSPAVLADILIEDGRITAVGTGLEIPADARRVDASGLHVIPGLIDGFAYHDLEHDALYAAAGVALVRDHGNDLGTILEARDPAQRDAAEGPLLSIAGAVLDGYPPSSSTAVVLRSEHEAHALVPALLDAGADFLAFQRQLPTAAWREVVALAHDASNALPPERAPEPPSAGADPATDPSAPASNTAGETATAADSAAAPVNAPAASQASAARQVQVWGPRLPEVALSELLASGQDGLVSLDGLLPAGRSWEDVQPTEFDANVAAVAAAGLRVTPLLMGTARLTEVHALDDPRLELLGPQYVGVWRSDASLKRESFDAAYLERARQVVAAQGTLLAKLQAAGVVLVPGSGAPHPWLSPGFGLQAELQLWQAAGLAPQVVLEAATLGAARALGLEQRAGIAAGQHADLVLLRADPSADVAALSQIEGVVQRGNWFARDVLDARIEATRQTMGAARRVAESPIEVAAPKMPAGELLLSGYVETYAAGARIAAERWAIVRDPEGLLVFGGNRRSPGGANEAPLELSVQQVLRERTLDNFRVELRTAGRELVVRGERVAGQMRVERRMDGQFLSNQAARENIAAIDASSVTTLLLIAASREEGPFAVIRFDQGLDLEVVRWQLAFEEDGDHWMRTHNGHKAAAFAANGALVGAFDWQGGGVLELRTVSVDDYGGEGLPLSEIKRERLQRAAEAAVGSSEPVRAAEAGAANSMGPAATPRARWSGPTAVLSLLAPASEPAAESPGASEDGPAAEPAVQEEPDEGVPK